MENLISENLYIFEEPELESIKNAVQEVLDIYAGEVMCISQRLYVTQCWSLTNKKMSECTAIRTRIPCCRVPFIIASCPCQRRIWSLPAT